MKAIRTLILALICGTALQMQAEVATTMVLTFNDETTASFNLADQPVVTFDATDMIITAKEIESKYPRTDVKEFHFLQSEVEGITPRTIAIEATAATIYNTAGQVVGTADAQAGIATVGLDQLPAGTYLIRTSNKTLKVTKR